MVRLGFVVIEVGVVVDGAGRGIRVKLGIKGSFFRSAGGCLYRCGSGSVSVAVRGRE